MSTSLKYRMLLFDTPRAAGRGVPSWIFQKVNVVHGDAVSLFLALGGRD